MFQRRKITERHRHEVQIQPCSPLGSNIRLSRWNLHKGSFQCYRCGQTETAVVRAFLPQRLIDLCPRDTVFCGSLRRATCAPELHKDSPLRNQIEQLGICHEQNGSRLAPRSRRAGTVWIAGPCLFAYISSSFIRSLSRGGAVVNTPMPRLGFHSTDN